MIHCITKSCVNFPLWFCSCCAVGLPLCTVGTVSKCIVSDVHGLVVTFDRSLIIIIVVLDWHSLMRLYLEIQVYIVTKWFGNWFCLFAAKVTLNMDILCVASCHAYIMLFCCHIPGDVFKIGVCIRVYWIWFCVPATVLWKA